MKSGFLNFKITNRIFYNFDANRRDARAVDRGGLENRCPATRDRGFESLSLRCLNQNTFFTTIRKR